jgi:probable DNA repair protein
VRALPWPAFVAELERDAVAEGTLEPRVRWSELAAAEAWRAAIEGEGVATLDPGALARSAEEAWALVHAYGSGAESWRAWTGSEGEPAAFARWADRYVAALERHGGSDAATAPDRIAKAGAAPASWRGRIVALAGFLDLDPQQKRAVSALERAGMLVERVPTLEVAPAMPQRAEFVTPRVELAAALAWARGTVESRAGARVGIVVPDFAQRLASVRLAAIDALGLPREGGEGSPAWNLSLGASIDTVPIVGAALDLIALAWTAIPAGRAAALLRSAHLPGAAGDDRRKRAALEREWLEGGVDPVRVGDVIEALRAHGDALATRIAAMGAHARRVRRASRRGWVDAWREALAIAGWPGDRTLGSAEHQATGAFDEHLAGFAALDALGGRGRGEIASDEAIGALAEILASSPFQPESPDAPIQVLGLYEAVGIPFDALWITGMSDEALPRAPRPHPLLPISWQRERGVPRSDAACELAHARDVASWLVRAAPDVIVSHATLVDDRPASRSTVFPAVAPTMMPVPVTPARAMFEARPVGERLVDDVAPAYGAGERMKAGSGLVAAQSDCPFQALASKRWRADPWPAAVTSLTPMERGTLVHEALKAFWGATRDHATLVALALDPAGYGKALRESAAAAIATLDAARWKRVPEAVRAIEEDRLARVIGEWLAIEASRRPFSVLGTEHEAALALAPLTLALRFDRVDRLDDGGVAILDYKTGGIPGIAKWQADRPEGVQMALYSLAWRAANPAEPVRAAVMAQVKRGDAKATGLYADEAARFCPKPERDDHAVVDWPVLEERWVALMRGLVASFARGEAAVSPRDDGVCRACARHALCRIGTAASDDEAGE